MAIASSLEDRSQAEATSSFVLMVTLLTFIPAMAFLAVFPLLSLAFDWHHGLSPAFIYGAEAAVGLAALAFIVTHGRILSPVSKTVRAYHASHSR